MDQSADLKICDAVLKPLQEEFEGKPAIAICIHDDSAHLGEPELVCAMMTRTMELGRKNLNSEGLNLALKSSEVWRGEEAALPIGENWRSGLYRLRRRCD
jgi:hypothetical protein